MRFDRCRKLFGDADFARIRDAHVLLLGAGGVGSFALDCLYRSGVGRITVIDHDTYDETNQNRQIGSEAVGRRKSEHLAALYPGIITIDRQLDRSWVAEFDFAPYDLILDAVDTTRVKIELARREYKKLIMSLGSARRIDPTQIRTTSIWRSQGDPMARKIRNELKRAKFDRNFTVVFSPETVRGEAKGSFVGVTGAFGLTLCSAAIRKIIDKPAHA